MMKIAVKSTLIISLLVLYVGCSEFRKIQKSDDWKMKYDAALNYYEKKDYYRAVILFDQIMPYIRGSAEAELVQFYYAYAHYYQKQYLLASHYFKTFHDTYNRSEYAEEAYYMYGYSLYKQSPVYNLEQSSTVEAITALQTFLNRYPNSEYRSEATNIQAALRLKLEKKAYEDAKLYYTLGELNSALISLDNFRKDFPDSMLAEEAAYLLVKASYKYAKESIYSRQKERYYDCIEHYEQFIDDYPDSEYIKDIQDYYSSSIDQIEKFKEETL
ncbi:MAG: outer membrane protein assembly factor BamD [Cyclobacteriaceae bacterium]|nr:outer membrane protein assembly factor BamD [Cyclobacteriaceae bacterium]